MRTTIYTLLYFFTISTTLANSAYDVDCEMEKLQEQTLTELVGQVERITKKDKKKTLSHEECRIQLTDAHNKYRMLAHHVYLQYRDYLNTFLTDVTRDTNEVKIYKKLVDYLRQKDMIKQMQAYSEANKKLEDVKDKDYDYRKKFQKKANKISDQIKIDLTSSYKILRKNFDKFKDKNPAVMPLTMHNCDAYYTNESTQDSLIRKRPDLNININPCSTTAYDYVPHPTLQNMITFEVQEGRVMMWFCHQTNKSERVQNKQGNYRPYRDVKVEAKANCQAYDLLNDKTMLGDQKQTHVSYEGNPYINISDSRMELAKSLGKTPLTYDEFVAKNPTFIPLPPKDFYKKAMPKECLTGYSYRRELENSEKAIKNAPSNSYGRDVEY